MGLINFYYETNNFNYFSKIKVHKTYFIGYFLKLSWRIIELLLLINVISIIIILIVRWKLKTNSIFYILHLIFYILT